MKTSVSYGILPYSDKSGYGVEVTLKDQEVIIERYDFDITFDFDEFDEVLRELIEIWKNEKPDFDGDAFDLLEE